MRDLQIQETLPLPQRQCGTKDHTGERGSYQGWGGWILRRGSKTVNFLTLYSRSKSNMCLLRIKAHSRLHAISLLLLWNAASSSLKWTVSEWNIGQASIVESQELWCTSPKPLIGS
jgi:hypothetical protein